MAGDASTSAHPCLYTSSLSWRLFLTPSLLAIGKEEIFPFFLILGKESFKVDGSFHTMGNSDDS